MSEAVEERVYDGGFLGQVGLGLAKAGRDPGPPLRRIGGHDPGDLDGVQDGEDVDGVLDVLEPLGSVLPALADDELVEAIVPWIGDVDGDAAVGQADRVVKEHVEEAERDGAEAQLFDVGRRFVALAGFGSEEFELQVRVLEEGGPVGVVSSFEAQGLERRIEIEDLPGEEWPGDEEINIDGLERKDPDAEVFLIHVEAPASDEFQAVVPEPGFIEGGEELLDDVILHDVPTGGASRWRGSVGRP